MTSDIDPDKNATQADPSVFEGDFVLDGHTFQSFSPASDAEELSWLILVTKDGKEVRREKIPMTYRPLFGIDASDYAAREARIEEIIKELGLEDPK